MKTLQSLSLATLLLAGGAWAGDHRYALSPTYAAECGSCHVAYPPALMDAASWKVTLQQLERHFGSDASLEPQAQREIASLLQAQASTRSAHEGKGAAPRLTTTAWFQRKHRPEELRGYPLPKVPAGARATPMAQCQQCHRRAEQGDFGEGSLQPADGRR